MSLLFIKRNEIKKTLSLTSEHVTRLPILVRSLSH